MLFKKPFTIKSNTFLKSSERKALKSLIKSHFSRDLKDTDLEEFHSKKYQIAIAKIVTYSDIKIDVYLVDKTPMFFAYKDAMFPTVFWLWKVPNMLSTFVVPEQVTNSIFNNSDLFRPGVVSLYPGGTHFYANDITSVITDTNKASIAVGLAENDYFTFISSPEGKCCKIFHRYGDYLCSTFDGATKPLPLLGTPYPPSETLNCDIVESIAPPEILEEPQENDEDQSQEVTSIMDEELERAFLAGIKYSKTFKAPMTAGTFYKTQILHQLPEFNIKKTSYKKFRPFLLKMDQEGVIVLKEVKVGIDQIESVDQNNPIYSKFYLPPEERPKVPVDEKIDDNITVIDEYLRVTNAVAPIFQLGIGTPLSREDVKEKVRKYVLENNCVDTDPSYVKPDSNLSKATKTEAPISWKELYESVCKSMKDCHVVKSSFTPTATLNTGKIRNIFISVANRMGNKKVTLVENLDQFKINLQEFGKDCQRGVGASSTINFPKGGKYEQVQVQGNQVKFVYDLLVDKYKVPKIYIKGLENAPKSKKKK